MSPLHLALLIHAHQPLGNFESVLEDVYRLSYLPFAQVVEQHPSIRVAFHYSGILLEWLEKRHPEYIEMLQGMVQRGQAEMLGGGYYEPVLGAIREADRLAQLERMSDFLESRFGRRPRGAWLTERVWEPTLPATLERAGVQYTLTDDYHFLSAGLQKEELHGYYLTTWQGSRVKVIPGLKSLRYLLPFRMENEGIAYLREVAEKQREQPVEPLAATGDDLEKFGAWPQTHKHVYIDGWLRRFFEAVEQSSGWLKVSLPGDYLETQRPLGLIYLPTASYQEMMGWSLPAGTGERYEELLHRVEQMQDGEHLAPFVHGGVWHNFFHKYQEANHMHKRVVELSRRYEELGPQRRAKQPEVYRQGYEDLLRAQCNDAYWHGIFGGLYAPHLRTGVYEALIRAEETVEKLEPAPRKAPRFDFNVDGVEEVFLSNGTVEAVVAAGDGGTVAEIDFRPRAFNAINSLRRRPEGYHAKLREAQRRQAEEAVSIHERVIAKEANLDHYLLYDTYNRHCFRSFVFGTGRTLEDYRLGRLEESHGLAAGPYEVVEAGNVGKTGKTRCELAGRDSGSLCEVRSVISVTGAKLAAEWMVRHSGLAEIVAGLELVLNLLAPDAPDRYFVLPGPAGGSGSAAGRETHTGPGAGAEADPEGARQEVPEGSAGRRPRLHWSGEVQGDCIALVDEWLNLRIDVRVRPAATWWILPIFTVSQSEGGFERVYQGSCLLPHWRLKNGELQASVELAFSAAR